MRDMSEMIKPLHKVKDKTITAGCYYCCCLHLKLRKITPLSVHSPEKRRLYFHPEIYYMWD